MSLFRFSGIVLAVVTMLVSLCFGGVKEAGASNGGSFEFRGFSVTYAGTDNVNYQDWSDPFSNFFVYIGSSSNTIDKVFASFNTAPEDTSYGVANLSITGTLDRVPSGDSYLSTGMFVNFGDVYLAQSNYIDTSSGQSFANVATEISNFDLWSCYLNYNEYESFDGEMPITRYTFTLTAIGSFGEGLEGDRRGLPFVPAPGSAFVSGLGVLTMVRRRR